MEVEVDAGDEDEARELAEKEAKDSSSYDWDDDDTMEITDVEKGECVDDDEESVG